jgi:hypothetical protein
LYLCNCIYLTDKQTTKNDPMIKVTIHNRTTLIVSKVVDSEKKAYRFGQDMAAKYEVLFSNTQLRNRKNISR